LFSFDRLLKILFAVLLVGVAGDLVYILATDLSLVGSLGRIRPGYLLLATTMVLVTPVAHAARIKLWSHLFGCPISPSQALKTSLISDLGAAATPTAVGGGYAKAFYLNRIGFSPGKAAMTTILGSVEDATFIVLTLPTVILVSRAWENPHVMEAAHSILHRLPYLAGAILLCLAVYLLWRRSRRDRTLQDAGIQPGESTSWTVLARRKLRSFWKDFLLALRYALRQGRWTFLGGVTCSAIGWSARWISINALILGFGLPVDFVLFPLLHWVVFSLSTVVVTPGGVGGAEVAFVTVFGDFVPAMTMPTLVAVWRFTTFYLVLLIGCVYLAFSGFGFARKLKPAAALSEAPRPDEVETELGVPVS